MTTTFTKLVESIREDLKTQADPLVRNFGEAIVEGHDRARATEEEAGMPPEGVEVLVGHPNLPFALFGKRDGDFWDLWTVGRVPLGRYPLWAHLPGK